jgi:hypothetical protein
MTPTRSLTPTRTVTPTMTPTITQTNLLNCTCYIFQNNAITSRQLTYTACSSTLQTIITVSAYSFVNICCITNGYNFTENVEILGNCTFGCPTLSLQECDVIGINGSNPKALTKFDYNTGSGFALPYTASTNTQIIPGLAMAKTNNKVVSYCNSGTSIGENILIRSLTANPYNEVTQSIKPAPILVSGNRAGLTFSGNSENILLLMDSNNISILDISGPTGTTSTLFQLSAGTFANGDLIYTTNNKLIMVLGNNISIPTQTYIAQYTLEGVRELQITLGTIGGTGGSLYVANNKLYFMKLNTTGINTWYEIGLSSPYTSTNMGPQDTSFSDLSQSNSCINVSFTI